MKGKKRLVREQIPPMKIGALCSDCTNPTEKVMQSYVFELGSIIKLGMFEKAKIAAEVLLEQGREPAAVMEEIIFPAIEEVRSEFSAKKLTPPEVVKALQSAEIALQVIAREKRISWEEFIPAEEEFWDVGKMAEDFYCHSMALRSKMF